MTLESALRTQPDVQAPPTAGSRGSTTLVALCFFLSGLAALLYQTAWMRQFATVFGTSEPAVAAVLAAYMTGLALGAAAAGRFLVRVRRPILVYGLLELGIAMGAFALPVGLHLARGLFQDVTGGLPEPPDAGGSGQFAFYLAATFLLVLIPTSFMGATLPLLARHAVRRESEIGKRIGGLYSINTVGAVIGTVVAAFVLLPQVGLQATVWCGVALNALVFVLAVVISNREGVPRALEEEPDSTRAPFSFALPLMAISGAIAFTYEVLWTRLFAHLLGGSVYAFATMLASFLAGIAIGSALASRHATTREQAVRGFAASQFGVAITSLLIYSFVDVLPALQIALGAGEDAGVLQNAVLAALVLLPSTLCLGATFPFAVRIAAPSAEGAARASARVFSWNTLGATAGALAAGFWILPSLEFHGTIRLCVLANMALAVSTYFLAREADCKSRALSGAGLALIAAFFWPSAPNAILASSPFSELRGQFETKWARVGSSCSAMVVKQRDEYQVRVNGLPQALVVPRGAPPLYGLHNRWLSALPIFARPEAESLCIIGLGGGVAAEGVPQNIQDIDVIELSHEVIEANEYLAELRNVDPLSDPRVRVIENDARSAFERTTKRWDIVVSQPSHPWTAGASHLFTREFAQLVHEHLTEEGVFLQWVSTRSFDMELLKTYGATLLSEFEHVRLYQSSTSSPLFLASDQPLEIEAQMLARDGLPGSSRQYGDWLGVEQAEDLAARLTLDTEGLRELCADTEPNSDDSNRLAMRPPSLSGRSAWVDMEALLAPIATSNELDPGLDPVQIIRRQLDLEFVARAKEVVKRIDSPARRAYGEFVIAQRTGEGKLALDKLHEAQDLDAEDPDVAFEIVLRELGGEASSRGELAYPALSENSKTVVAAWPCLINERWEELRGFDESLSQVRSDEPCFFLALQLRALWRVHSPGTEVAKARHALEAIDLVDRAIAIGPNVALLALRAEAGALAGEKHVLLESASVLTNILVNQPLTAGNQRHAARVHEFLAELEGDESLDAERLSEMRFRLGAMGNPGFGATKL